MITPPFACTRRFYVEEEVIVSICNYCYAVVAQTADEAELEKLENQHACVEKVKTQGLAA